MEYQIKTKGFILIKRLIACCKRNKNCKHITMTLEQAQTIVDDIQGKISTYDIKSNSVKASAIGLCMKPEELCERLNAKHPKELNEKILRLTALANAMYERAVKDSTGLWLTEEFQNWNKRNQIK